MKTHHRFIPMLCLSVTSVAVVACDEPAEERAELRAELSPVADEAADPGVWPLVGPFASAPDAAARTAPRAETANHYGPREKLVRGWVRWLNAQPWTDGPLSDTTGENCAMGQEGPVWFLAGTSGGPVTRACDVPADKQLFFPLVNRWCVFFPEYYPTDESVEAALPARYEWMDLNVEATCALTLRVDGVDVLDFDDLNEDLYIRVEEPFDVDYNEQHFNAPYGLAGGTIPTIADGHYARLAPLSPGDHVIEFGGALCDGGATWFETSATYLLHVADPDA